MIVDGKQIQENIKKSLKEKVANSEKEHKLAVVYVGNNPVISRFVEMKKSFGQDIGVGVDIFRLKDNTSEDLLKEKIVELNECGNYGGIIVQLPLPEKMDVQNVLNTVSSQKDVDVLSEGALAMYDEGQLRFVPTVAGAVHEILQTHHVTLKDKKVVIIGKGKLVGDPVKRWLVGEGVNPIVFDEGTELSRDTLGDADVIISGAGVPEIVKPEMVKNGVVLIDAGTSEQAGKLAGDIDRSCEEKASLFTPVPGGVGPVTIAILFKNLCQS